MTEANNNSEANVTTPVGSLSFKGKRTSEFIAILSMAALILIGYVLYEHKSDTKESAKEFSAAVKEMTSAQRENTAAQRELNCLIAIPQDQREKQAEFCKRIAR